MSDGPMSQVTNDRVNFLPPLYLEDGHGLLVVDGQPFVRVDGDAEKAGVGLEQKKRINIDFIFHFPQHFRFNISNETTE